MNLKKILFTCLILMILSITAVSVADSDNIKGSFYEVKNYYFVII